MVMNRRNIGGTKVRTVPTPPMIPFASRDPSQPGEMPIANPAMKSKPAPIKSISGADRVKVNWNIPYMTARNIGMPSQRLTTTRSILFDDHPVDLIRPGEPVDRRPPHDVLQHAADEAVSPIGDDRLGVVPIDLEGSLSGPEDLPLSQPPPP